MGGLEFIPYDKKAVDAFFKSKEEQKKRDATEAAKNKKGGQK